MLETIDSFLLRRTMQVSHDVEELTALELLAKITTKTNEAVNTINDIDERQASDKIELNASIKKKVDIVDLEDNRKLSANGNFTGTIGGRTIASIFADIVDALGLSHTIIDMVNDRESIGTIYDGGYFLDTNPPTITVEGGLY